jgi:hypothetical protein
VERGEKKETRETGVSGLVKKGVKVMVQKPTNTYITRQYISGPRYYRETKTTSKP